jgi:hypothetical protein
MDKKPHNGEGALVGGMRFWRKKKRAPDQTGAREEISLAKPCLLNGGRASVPGSQ